MASLRKREEPPSTKPGHRAGAATAAARTRSITPPPSTMPERADDRRNRSEAPTIPPPPETAPDKRSGIRAKRKGKTPNAATVDEVVADLSRDPRREEED
jgi:hypothetical protein